jgi:hypothetical protein
MNVKVLADEVSCPICGEGNCDHDEAQKLGAKEKQTQDLAQQETLYYNSGDRSQVDKRTRRLKAVANVEADDLIWQMSSDKGRRQMWRLLERAGVFQSSFKLSIGMPDGHGAALMMSFKEGERNIGLAYIDLLMRHCAENYQLMVKENGAKT